MKNPYINYVKKGIHNLKFTIAMPQVGGVTKEYLYQRQLKTAWRVWYQLKYSGTSPDAQYLSNPKLDIGQDEYGLFLEQRVSGRAKHFTKEIEVWDFDSIDDIKTTIRRILIPKEQRPPLEQ